MVLGTNYYERNRYKILHAFIYTSQLFTIPAIPFRCQSFQHQKEEVIMKRGKKVALILMTLLLPGAYQTFGQSAEEILPKAMQLQEVKGELEEALILYQSILDEYPENREICAKAMLNMGICYEKLGSEQARQAYRNVINKYAGQEEEVALAIERISHLDAYVADLNKQAEQHMQQGNELFKLWAYEDAVREYESALKLRPNTLLAMNAQYCIGQSWYRAGNYNAALATFSNLMEENPNSTLAPVTELMISQVEYAIENIESPVISKSESDGNSIVDPETGITYRKINTFTGKNDVIEWTPSARLSPNGNFLVSHNTIIPMDNSDPYEFTDMQVGFSAWSPDGNTIAFTSGDSSIFMVPVSQETGRTTSPPKNLMKRDRACNLSYLTWSPDSKKLFYHLFNYPEKEYTEIFSINTIDGVIKPLTMESIPQINPACSPDGKTIAFKGPYRDLWICPTEGGAAKKLLDKGHTRPNWTPDGNWIFSDGTVYGWPHSLNFLRFSDNFEFELTPPAKAGTFLSLTPGDYKLLFYRPSYQLIWGVKITSATGGPPYEPVPHLPAYGARWAKNSKMIIIGGEEGNIMEGGENVTRIVPISGGDSYVLDLDMELPGKLSSTYLSPDYKNIFFKVAGEYDNEDLYMAPISIEEARVTGPPTRIFENWNCTGAYNTRMSISHDGKKLAFIHKEDIWIYDLEDGSLKQITSSPEVKKWVSWSPDNRKISYWAFVEKPDWNLETRIIPSEGGDPIKTLKDCRIYPGGWSPNSESVIMYSRDKVVLFNIVTDKMQGISELISHRFDDIGNWNWSPDGSSFLIDGIEEVNSEKRYHLCRVPVSGGDITELATGDYDFKYDISYSPDGKWICYCYEKMEKVRPESTMWEADFEEVLDKLASEH
jgi:Tol biopolymer transport system component/outer membrane protein assembly factor BamD (BamD/ComL family)